MTALVWEDRDYEAGVDRGVLYNADSTVAVPWNGLTSVEEVHVGGGVKSSHLDGVNFLNVVSARQFQAIVTAFSAPREFSDFAGDKQAAPGFYMTRQPKPRFTFSYRVMTDDSYEIHLVYNCLATPEPNTSETLSDSIEPKQLSWIFDATPTVLPNFRPTAHFIVNPLVNPTTFATLEDRLYGTESLDPDCPTPAELVIMFD